MALMWPNKTHPCANTYSQFEVSNFKLQESSGIRVRPASVHLALVQMPVQEHEEIGSVCDLREYLSAVGHEGNWVVSIGNDGACTTG